MDVQCRIAILVTYLTWIIFQLAQYTSSSYLQARLRIKKGSNISMFDLDNLIGYECGSLASGLYRDPNIDTTRELGCPVSVLVCFQNCDAAVYYVAVNTYNKTGDLFSWIKTANVAGGISLSLNENGFDFVVNNMSSSLTRAAVYNPGPPHVRPRIFAIPLHQGDELISNIFKAENMTKFLEYTTLEVKYIFLGYCKKPTKFITNETCQEAFEDAKKQTLPEPTTTVQPVTSGDGGTSNITGIGSTTQNFSGLYWKKLYPDSKEHESMKVSSSGEMSEIYCIVQCQFRGETFADIELDTESCICYNSDPQTKGNLWKRPRQQDLRTSLLFLLMFDFLLLQAF